jgi:hypothetical protein
MAKIDASIIYKRLKDLFPLYEFDMGIYTNTHCKIPVICDKGHQSIQLVKNILKGHGCKKCSTKLVTDDQKSKIEDVLKSSI